MPHTQRICAIGSQLRETWAKAAVRTAGLLERFTRVRLGFLVLSKQAACIMIHDNGTEVLETGQGHLALPV